MSNKAKEIIRAVKFTIVSISAGIIQLGTFVLMHEVLNWIYWPSYLISLLLSVIWNFTVNRKVTFKSSNNVKVAMLLVLLFYAVFTPVSTILGHLATEAGIEGLIVEIITMIANFVLEFLYTRFIVYRNSCDTKEQKSKHKRSVIYIIVRFFINIFYKKRTIDNIENLPDEASIIVANHAQMHGPICSELYFPSPKYTWCIGNMMKTKEVTSYAFNDFWSNKPKWNRWFFKILSYIIAPLASSIFTSADTIAVYHDTRITSTFKETVRKLNDGANIIIFPEYPVEYNDIVNEFQDKFIDVARLYYKKYNKELSFVPMYNAVRLKKMVIGKPIKYNPNIPIEEQRKLICDYIKEEITRLAKELPVHKVLPYNNVGRKNYKNSK